MEIQIINAKFPTEVQMKILLPITIYGENY